MPTLGRTTGQDFTWNRTTRQRPAAKDADADTTEASAA